VTDDVFSDRVPELAEHHRRYLHDAAITDEVIAQNKICSNAALDHIIFPWTDGEKTVFVTRPDKAKSVKQKYVWPAGVPIILWKLRPAAADQYILVEGVKQSLAVQSWAPYHYGIVGMNGAWGWSKTDLSWTKDKDITIILDGDRRINDSVAKASEALQRTLERYNCRSVNFASLPTAGTDGIDDILSRLPTEDRRTYLQTLLDSASFAGRRIQIKSALDYRPKRKRWLYQSFLPLGNLCLLAGYEGTAKSTVTTDLVAKVSRGELDGEFFGEPRRIIYVTGEEDWDQDILPRLIAAGANLGNVLSVFIQHESGAEMMVSLDRDLQELERVIEENSVVLMVFDSLLYFLGDRVDYDKSSPINDLLLPLVQVGIRNSCTMLGILHFNKGSHQDNPLNKISNSKAFTRIARSVLMTASHEDHFILSAEKLSSSLRPESLSFRLEQVFLPEEWNDEGQPVSSVKVEWLGNSDVSVSEIMDMVQRGESTSSKEVNEWLQSYLDSVGGEATWISIKNAAAKDGTGYSDATLRRAKARLSIEHVRSGFQGAMSWRYTDPEMEHMKQRVRESMGM